MAVTVTAAIQGAVRFAAAALVVAGAARVGADVWDVQTQSDNSSATENELVHGSEQIHDLGALVGPAADQDWFKLYLRAYSSYEVVVDATSGDIGSTLQVDRVDATPTIFGSALSLGHGFSRSMRVHNPNAVDVTDKFIRVISGSCTTSCGADDAYRIRFYETTASIPRFNNSGTQVTVVILQNPTAETIVGTVYFWNASGALLASSGFNLLARQSLVLPTSGIGGLAGQSGSITIGHDGRYGELAGKAVALEPSTGFSFDTALVVRPH